RAHPSHIERQAPRHFATNRPFRGRLRRTGHRRAPDTTVTIIIRDDAVWTARAWAGHRRTHRTSETGSSWARSSVEDRFSLRSSCPDSTVGLMTHRFSASMVAALLAAVLGIGHAAFSAYWAIGGTWLLDTIGGELERWGRERHPSVVVALWLIAVLKSGVAVAAPVLVLGPGRLPAWTTGRAARALSWIAAVVLTAYGGVLTAVGLLVQSGAVEASKDGDQRALAWHAFGGVPSARAVFEDLLRGHDVPLDGEAQVDALLFVHPSPPGRVMAQIDFVVAHPAVAGSRLVESFAAHGTTWREAIHGALHLFERASLHPLIDGLLRPGSVPGQVQRTRYEHPGGAFDLVLGPQLTMFADRPVPLAEGLVAVRVFGLLVPVDAA